MIINSLSGQLEAYRVARQGTQDAANAKKAIGALSVTRLQSKPPIQEDTVRVSALASQTRPTKFISPIKDPIATTSPVGTTGEDDRPIKHAPIVDSDGDSVVDIRPIKPGVGKTPLPAPLPIKDIAAAGDLPGVGVAQPVKPVAREDDAKTYSLNDVALGHVRKIKTDTNPETIPLGDIANTAQPVKPIEVSETSAPIAVDDESIRPIKQAPIVDKTAFLERLQAARSYRHPEPVIDYYTPVDQTA